MTNMEKFLATWVSGYIGNHCAAELLKSGYSVRESLRDLSKTKLVSEAIENEVGSKENLDFCELILNEDNGWNDAMSGWK